MKNFKNIILNLMMIFIFIGCTEVYNPEISTDTEALIVEGLITNETGPFVIKLTKAKPLSFDSINSVNHFVSGAIVKIVDGDKKTYELNESSPGKYFTSSGFKTKIGNTYTLFINTNDGNRYQSNTEMLLSPQSYDSIRGVFTKKDYLNSKNEVKSVTGAEIFVNLFKSIPNNEPVPACRFVSDITVQYHLTFNESYWEDGVEHIITDWFWFCFGWNTFRLSDIENITEQKNNFSNAEIKNHSIGFMPFDASDYNMKTFFGTNIPQTTMIYYLTVNQYTMNSDTYRFYKAANNQLSADGKIFDPISSQLLGNMRCVNNPEKIVLGLFEVSSVKKQAVLVKGSTYDLSKKVNLNNTTFLEIPKANAYMFKVWDAAPENNPINKDPLFTPVAFPSWWYHNDKKN